MFQFEDITLVNYGYFPNCSFPDLEQGHTIVTGENGSGKSTLVDAFLLALGAKTLTHGRSASEHVGSASNKALIILHVSNPVVEGKAKQRFWEPEGCKQDTVTIACLLTRSGSSPKRNFLIIDGQKTEAEVKELIKTTKPMGATTYRQKLEKMGLSQDKLEMLIIRQDMVAKICEKDERSLYEFVLRMLGDPRVLNNYEESLEVLTDLETEVKRLEDQLLDERRSLRFKQEDFARWEQYRDAKENMRKSEMRREAAMLQVHLKDRDEADAKYQEESVAHSTQSTLLDDAKKALQEAKDAHAEATKRASTVQRRFDDAKANLDLAKKRVTELEPDFQAFQTARSNLTKLPKTHLETAQAQLARATEAKKQADDALARQAEVVAELQRECKLLEEGKPRLPREVEATFSALDEAGIAYTPIFGLVEPTDARLEDSLGDLRFSIIVEANDLDAAVKLAQEADFPSSIYTGKLSAAGEFDAGSVQHNAPAWLHDAIASHKARRIGFSNEYGHWTRRVNEHVLGTRDWEAELEALRGDLASAETELAACKRQAETTQAEYDGANRLLVLVEQRIENEEIRDKYRETEAQMRAAQEEREVKQGEFSEVESEKRTASERVKLYRSSVVDHERHVKAIQSTVTKAEAAMSKWQARFQSAERLIETTQSNLDASLIYQAKSGDLASPESYEDDRDRYERIAASFDPVPDESIVQEVQLVEKTVNEFEANLSKRKQERLDQIESMQAARNQYIRLVNGLFQDYSKRLKSFQSTANVTISAEPPRFQAETTTDDDIRKATFPVQIAFSGKPLRAINDQRLSGGQRALTGLILLMALPTQNSNGFFVIDEPYGALSANRVEEVSSFIAKTPLQIIITLPTNFDPGHYTAGSRVINVLEAKAGSKLAPMPQLGVVGP